jgi:hypothetical protein
MLAGRLTMHTIRRVYIHPARESAHSITIDTELLREARRLARPKAQPFRVWLSHIYAVRSKLLQAVSWNSCWGRDAFVIRFQGRMSDSST